MKGDALLPGLHEEVLEVEQGLLGRVHVHERGRDPGLPAAARATNLVHVVLDLLGHGEDDDVLDVVEVEALGRDARGDHHVLRAGLEGLDDVLPLFLRCRTVVSVCGNADIVNGAYI